MGGDNSVQVMLCWKPALSSLAAFRCVQAAGDLTQLYMKLMRENLRRGVVDMPSGGMFWTTNQDAAEPLWRH
jgi:hypothetical protein